MQTFYLLLGFHNARLARLHRNRLTVEIRYFLTLSIKHLDIIYKCMRCSVLVLYF